MTEQNELVQPTITVGQQLQTARQEKQLTVPYIAQQMCLKEHVIHALENDAKLDNVASTFVKGYVRAYAKLLELDGEALVAQYNEAHRSDPNNNATMISFSRKVARENVDSKWMLVTYGVISVIILMIIIWWYQQSQTSVIPVSQNTLQESVLEEVEREPVEPVSQPEMLTETASQSGPEQSLPAPETIISDVESLTDEALTAAALVVEELSIEQIEPEVSENTASEVSDIEQVINALENADPDSDQPILSEVIEIDNSFPENIELVFTFEKDCWIKITDATEDDIAYGVKKAGRVMPVSGKPPFKVVLGAPAGVNITYNGEAVDLSDFPTNRTARFNLPLEAE